MALRLKGLHINTYMIKMLLIASLGSITYGYTAGSIAPALGLPSFVQRMNLDAPGNTSRYTGALNGVFQAAGIIATYSTPWVADRWGRKRVLYIAAAVNIISAGLCAGSVDIAMFLVCRFIAGLGCYALLGSIPLWMCEVVPPNLRGTLMDFHGVFILIGYVIVDWIGFGLVFWDDGGNGDQWRLLFALQAVFPILLLLGLPQMVESPRWFVLQGRNNQALAILERLHSDKEDSDHSFARHEYVQIQRQVELEKKYSPSWMTMFRKPSYRKRMALALSTTVFVASSGVLVIANYATIIYATLGYDAKGQLLLLAASTMCSWGGTMISMLFVDRLPRPKFLGIGLFGCATCLILEAALVKNFATVSGPKNESALKAAVVFVFLFGVSFNIGLDATQYTYAAEMFPTFLRAKGTAVAASGVPIANLLWLEIAPVAFENIGWKTYLIFVCTGGTGAILLFFFYPDTKGVPLEEVAAIFGDAEEVAVFQQELESSAATEADSEQGAKHIPEAEHLEAA